MKREYIVQQAIEQAWKSTMLCKHGAVIIKNNKIISRGYNRHLYYYGGHPQGPQGHRSSFTRGRCVTNSIHAEVDALRKCYPKSNLNGAVLYVVRVRYDGSTAISKPCKGCSRAISKSNLSGVYCSN